MHLQRKQDADHMQNQLVISRQFNAGIETVFQAWSKAGHMQQWWGRDEIETIIKSFVFKPGGVFHYAFVVPGCRPVWGKLEYREIQEPHLIVFVNSFSDEKGSSLKPPDHILDGSWPLLILNTVTLEAISPNETKLTLEAHPQDATENEQKKFDDDLPKLQQGFKLTFDRLERFLSTQ